MGELNPMRSSPNQKPLLPNKSLLPTKEASNRVNKAKEFEKEFNYGKKGIVPTQRDWAEYFWTVHKNRVAEALRPPIGEAISMLVVGVGTGDVLSAIDIQDKAVVGVDINKNRLADATKYCRPVVSDGSNMPFKDESFDLVICNMVLHHIIGQGSSELKKTLSECARVLKKSARLFIFEPNIYHPSGIGMSLLSMFHLYHKLTGGSEYEFALSPFRLARICRSFHLEKVKISAITFAQPRLPLFIQNLFFRTDKYFSRIYPLSFSFILEAVKS